MATKKKGTGPQRVKSAINPAAATETIVDLVSRLGLVDIVVGRLKAKLEETDVDELFDDLTDYMRRNPEVLVASLGAITVATALVVFLNNRREWDGMERRQREA
jgi:hypothetical protein